MTECACVQGEPCKNCKKEERSSTGLEVVGSFVDAIADPITGVIDVMVSAASGAAEVVGECAGTAAECVGDIVGAILD